MKTKLLSALSALLMVAMTSCNGNGGTNVVDGGHGIGIDTATVNAINRAEEAADQSVSQSILCEMEEYVR